MVNYTTMISNVLVVVAALISGPLTAWFLGWERDRAAVRMGRFVDKLTKWRGDGGRAVSTDSINRAAYLKANPKDDRLFDLAIEGGHLISSLGDDYLLRVRIEMDAFMNRWAGR